MRALLALALAIAATVAAGAAAPAGAAGAHLDVQGVNRFVSVEMDKHRVPSVAVDIIGENGVVDVQAMETPHRDGWRAVITSLAVAAGCVQCFPRRA